MSDEKNNSENETNKEGEKQGDETTKSATIGDVERIVESAIEKIKSAFPGSSEPDGGDTSDDKDGEKGKENPRIRRGRSLRDVQTDVENQVRSQIKEVLGEIEHEKEHESIKHQRQEPQSAPVKKNRFREFMLGKDWDKT